MSDPKCKHCGGQTQLYQNNENHIQYKCPRCKVVTAVMKTKKEIERR